MKRTIIKVFVVVLAIITVFFLYVFVRSLSFNLSLQRLNVDDFEKIQLRTENRFTGTDPNNFEPTYASWITDKTVMKDCLELLQRHTYKYQTAGTPFTGYLDVYIRFQKANGATVFELQMYREKDDARNLGIKTMYKGHEYYINRFSEVEEIKLYDMFYELEQTAPKRVQDIRLP